MRFTARAAALAAAVAFARRGTDAKSQIPVLGCVLLRANGSAVEIIGHNLTSSHTTTCAATVEQAGAGAVSVDRLAALLGAMSGNFEVTIACVDGALTVMAGCS